MDALTIDVATEMLWRLCSDQGICAAGWISAEDLAEVSANARERAGARGLRVLIDAADNLARVAPPGPARDALNEYRNLVAAAADAIDVSRPQERAPSLASLFDLGADVDPSLRAWLVSVESMEPTAAYEACPRAAWLVWLAHRAGIDMPHLARAAATASRRPTAEEAGATQKERTVDALRSIVPWSTVREALDQHASSPETVRDPSARRRRKEDVAQLAADGTVELPLYVREGLGVKPGDYLAFVRDPRGEFRVMSAAQLARELEGR